jgi:hypothetical protein
LQCLRTTNVGVGVVFGQFFGVDDHGEPVDVDERPNRRRDFRFVLRAQ